MKELIVGKNDAGQRLDRFVGKAVPLLPESLLQKYIRLKRIKLNGKGSKRDVRVAEGDVLSLYINDEFFEKPTERNSYLKVGTPRLDVVYQKGEWRPREENAFAPALCNRIDRNTGGIVIAAKNAEALRIMNEKIKEREIEKYYLCVVRGRPKPAEGALRGYIFKDAAKNRVYVRSKPEPGAKEAVTYYRTLASANGLSLVECRLGTGRTHQIRAQMSAAGWPLLGDGKYGSDRENKKLGEDGQLLYSYRLEFAFQTYAGALNYLNGRSFSVAKVDFAEKYFPGIRF